MQQDGVGLILLKLSRIEQGQAALTTKVDAMAAELVDMKADIAITNADIAGLKTAVDLHVRERCLCPVGERQRSRT